MTDWDYTTAYRELRDRVSNLVRERASEIDELAPATPEWRLRDIVAHMAGICDDVAQARLDGVGSDAWTSAQVDPRRDWPVDQLLDDWHEHSTTIEPQIATFPPVIVGQMITDAFTHEQDIRGALRAPGGRHSLAADIAFDWGSDRLGDRMTAQHEGSLTLETDCDTKTVGSGKPATRLRADRFDITRSFMGRRSKSQLEAMDWDGPFDPEHVLLSTELFRPAATDIVE
jgi:uncharacterized protein (TIGR03083 family)